MRVKERWNVTTALPCRPGRELIRLTKRQPRMVAALPAALIERAGDAFVTPFGDRSRRRAMAGAAHDDDAARHWRASASRSASPAPAKAPPCPLVNTWKEEGRSVFGITLAWRQAGDLGAAGIEERAAVAAFIKRVEGGQYALDRNSVIVVNEVGQLGTRQLLELLRVQERTGAQIVMIGDPKQCQSIEAGPVIDLLRNALGEDAIPQILTSIRQKTERDANGSACSAPGLPQALEMKQRDGTAELVAGGRQATVQRVAQLWRERIDANRADPEFKLTNCVRISTARDLRFITSRHCPISQWQAPSVRQPMARVRKMETWQPQHPD